VLIRAFCVSVVALNNEEIILPKMFCERLSGEGIFDSYYYTEDGNFVIDGFNMVKTSGVIGQILLSIKKLFDEFGEALTKYKVYFMKISWVLVKNGLIEKQCEHEYQEFKGAFEDYLCCYLESIPNDEEDTNHNLVIKNCCCDEEKCYKNYQSLILKCQYEISRIIYLRSCIKRTSF